MGSSSLLRAQIESSLAPRVLSVFSTLSRPSKPLASTGILELDRLLGGGLPVGSVCEITGPECSGRTSIALAFLAQVTRQGGVAAWVDVADTLDPESAAAAGVELSRLLWVRCSEPKNNGARKTPARDKPWSRLDQALRAADLILQAGGFGAIVFDMGNVAPEHSRRVPLASWFRFRQAAERTQATFLLLSQISCAQSCAAAQLRTGMPVARSASNTVLNGLQYEATLVRRRDPAATVSKKPPASDHATWDSRMTWARRV